MRDSLVNMGRQVDGFTYEIPPEKLVSACEKARRDGYEHLSLITAVDWEDRWEVIYHLIKFGSRRELTLIVNLPKDEPVVPSLTGLWPSADWHERETYDLMGIHFQGHPDLRRILLPKEYGEHPLRKEVPHGNRS